MWKRWIEAVFSRPLLKLYGGAYAAAVAMALGVALIPLFNVPGYESSALFGGILGLMAVGLSLRAIDGGWIRAPLEDRDAGTSGGDFGALALLNMGLMVAPLVLLSLNGFWVPVCDWGVALGMWGLIVAPAILLGQCSAWLGQALFERRWGAWAVGFGLPLADGIALMVHLALEPPIIGHQWLIGYFAGSIYDEALGIPTSLIAYRVILGMAMVVVVAGLHSVWAMKRARRGPGWSGLLCIVMAVGAMTGWVYRQEFGIGIDRAMIVEELGGTVESEHFIIHYSDTASVVERRDEMVADHEFRYAQMREFFGVDPVGESGQKLRSFVYGDPDSKGALMGARTTMVAKLWLQEMHILWRYPGDSMLAHELAHLFTESFGAGPLSLSMQRGIGVNMGLVEGVATAAEWPVRDLSPHEATAAMRTLDMAPDLRRLFGASGFWTEASGSAYTAMGSFVRFLIDEEGMEAFQQAYPRGDFKGAYGEDAAGLIERWEAFLDGQELNPAQLRLAAHQYDRPTIFERRCARALAERHRQAADHRRAGALNRAREGFESVVADDPKRLEASREWVGIKRQLGHYESGYRIADEALGNELSHVDQAYFIELKGDIEWTRGDGHRASDHYRQAIDKAGESSHLRRLHLKARLADDRVDRARKVLVERKSAGPRVYHLLRWFQDDEEGAEVNYLLGRHLWQRGEYDEALAYLERAHGRMGSSWLDDEASMMLGQSLMATGRGDQAEVIWEALSLSQSPRSRQVAKLWQERQQWMARE